MIDPKHFAENMLLEAIPEGLDFASLYEHNNMRKIYAAIQQVDIVAGTDEIQLSDDTVDVVMAAYNRVLIYKTKESILDTLDPSWRTSTALAPRSYVWRGEEALQKLRLWPVPTVDGRLLVVKLVEPDLGVALWHNVLLGLSIVDHLAISDTLRARPKLSDFATGVIALVLAPFGIKDQRGDRFK